MIYQKDIIVVHHRDFGLRSFMRQSYNYGRGNLLVRHLHDDHPLLKELNTGKARFWVNSIFIILKTPFFAKSLGQRLIEEEGINNRLKKIAVYALFGVHKILYLLGSLRTFLSIYLLHGLYRRRPRADS